MTKDARSRKARPADPAPLDTIRPYAAGSAEDAPRGAEALLQVIIETPRGSRNKYAFDEQERLFQLKRTLPAGMVFPFDFGFVPQTIGGDGDPLDVLVLMEAPCFPGCAVRVRLLGVMETEQTVQERVERNDRLIGVAETAHLYEGFKTVADLPKQLRTEIAAFFQNYHRLIHRESRTLAWKGPAQAQKLVAAGRRKARMKDKGL